MTRSVVGDCRRDLRRRRRPSKRWLAHLILVAASGLVLWRGLVAVTRCASPIVVVLSGSPPTLILATLSTSRCKAATFAIAHRVLQVHTRKSDGVEFYLTKGDDNNVNDRGLYAPGQLWLQRRDILGVARASIPYVGQVVIAMNDYPLFKIVALGLITRTIYGAVSSRATRF
ncbi:hypothetical protein SDRG_13537 [Saprolegnia diclina VS20]|uniref:Signal peptidase complex catalytic subunit SEC11 n=1 Tax=Saprolegnia diclina (strain VS20) TaxID=1156394 RepID=T0Q5F4_SAPDV|nr:hypothetical protein SDRG_13537 [Saprolegnia diclina VS20]EQC28660.1 hypothetical protein SDRG_13537 [Saprolegnia diclina VS20]|eukprot:XP_008617852.1 hypothetical protein SDRG_13537 [Saprolegnia diclina VS20]